MRQFEIYRATLRGVYSIPASSLHSRLLNIGLLDQGTDVANRVKIQAVKRMMNSASHAVNQYKSITAYTSEPTAPSSSGIHEPLNPHKKVFWEKILLCNPIVKFPRNE